MLPVIDQGKDLIAGFVDDIDLRFRGHLPVIVFGDHTRILKYVDFPFAVGADGTRLIAPSLDLVDVRFFYYALCNLRLRNLGYSRHFKLLQEQTVRFPESLSEQRTIAAILSSIDDAIEKTQAVVDQAQVVKRGMMQELFTRGIPGRHTTFKQTEIGRMPEEWTPTPGIDLFRLSGGYGPSSIAFDNQGECLFVKVNSFNHQTNRSLILHADDRFSEINNPTIRLHSPGSLVFPKRGAAIFKNRVRLLGTNATVDPNLMVMTPKHDLVPGFLMYLLIHIELFNLSDNSGIPQLNNKHLYPKLFPVPAVDEQESIAKSMRAADDRIASEEEKMMGLSRLKQALMSVLLTGEVRVTVDTEAA